MTKWVVVLKLGGGGGEIDDDRVCLDTSRGQKGEERHTTYSGLQGMIGRGMQSQLQREAGIEGGSWATGRGGEKAATALGGEDKTTMRLSRSGEEGGRREAGWKERNASGTVSMAALVHHGPGKEWSNGERPGKTTSQIPALNCVAMWGALCPINSACTGRVPHPCETGRRQGVDSSSSVRDSRPPEKSRERLDELSLQTGMVRSG